MGGFVSLLGLLRSSGSSVIGVGSARLSILSLLLAPLRMVLLNYAGSGNILAKNRVRAVLSPISLKIELTINF